MSQKEEFFEYINNGYNTKGDFLELGAAMLGEETVTNAIVKVPLKTLNRHGLIAGATGTGKTKTLQVLAENLSEKGIPVLLMDVKGDLSGLAKPQLSIYGEDALSLECSTTIEPPEVPEPPQPEFDNICRYFPEPIQGWKGPTSKLDITNNAARVTGWSTQYVAKHTIDRKNIDKS